METETFSHDARAYTPASLAKALGLGDTKTRELLATGSIRSFKVGRRIVVPSVEVDRWIAERLATCGDAPISNAL